MTSTRALVTGGTRGIGLAVARKLAGQGIAITVTGRSKAPTGEQPFDFYAVDFTQGDETSRFLEFVRASRFDVVVNNAGINRIAPIVQAKPSDFQLVQRVNLEVPFLIAQATVPSMRAQGWGRIVNIGSIWAHVSRADRSAYSASKSALLGLTRAIAAEVGREGILVNTVSPGVIETELTREILGEAGMEQLRREIPLGRLGNPEEVAEVVAFLAGKHNTYISGQSIIVDGGFTSV